MNRLANWSCRLVNEEVISLNHTVYSYRLWCLPYMCFKKANENKRYNFLRSALDFLKLFSLSVHRVKRSMESSNMSASKISCVINVWSSTLALMSTSLWGGTEVNIESVNQSLTC